MSQLNSQARHRRNPNRASRPVALVLAFLRVASLHAAETIPATEPVASAMPTPLATIPFQHRDGHVMIPATLGGVTNGLFMLDTGYSLTTVAPRFVEALSLRQSGSVKIVGIIGEEQTPLYEGSVIMLGGVEYRPRRLAALSPDQSRRRDGVIGAGLFRRFVVDIDPNERQIRLYEPAGFEPAGAWQVIPLRFQDGTPLIEAAIGMADGVEIKTALEVDTGCDASVCLGRRFLADHPGVNLGESTRSSVHRGVGGETQTQSGQLHRVTIGGIEIERPSANFFPSDDLAEPGIAGHVGYGLLRSYRQIFDYRQNRLFLKPASGASNPRSR